MVITIFEYIYIYMNDLHTAIFLVRLGVKFRDN